ncbi:restriction endonuclease subunit S [Prevotella jejuni]|uniref:restriction endonuclease subunit S n=1 Tax=Prevotella jejuni TaxID=1177574 RepID=UPI0028DC31C0|nr:restriction endonuclease subunit S [Prevotella jejuni]
MKPKIRIKGFNDAWEYSYLYNCLEISTEVNKENKYGKDEVLSVSDDFGVVNQIKHLGRSYAGKSVSGYKILLPGQIVYTKSPLRDKPFGIIKENNYQAGIVSVLYAVYNVKEGIFSKYIQRYFEPKQRINKYLVPLVNKGAKNTMNISDEMSLNGKITKPVTICEQQAICSYFDKVDELISTASSRLASLKQVKEASLQAMFPQKGGTVPKIRFKGFEEEWEEVKLSSFAKRIKRRNSCMESTLALTIASALGLISQNDYFNNSVVGANIRNYYILKRGEFAYNKSYSNGYPFGSVKRLDRYEQGILSTLYIVFTIDDSISSDYLTHFFDTTLWHKDVAERAAEGARNHGLLNISAEDFLDIAIWKPRSIEEQQHIASYFTSLDKQIALQTQRLEKLKQIKAACLDKMFV